VQLVQRTRQVVLLRYGAGDVPGFRYVGRTSDDQGMYLLDGAAGAVPPRPRAHQPDADDAFDYEYWEDLDRKCRMHLDPERLRTLAAQLGVRVDALEALGAGWHKDKQVYVFPEDDAKGRVVGLAIRNPDGTGKKNKWMVGGSKRALYLPQGWKERALAQKVVYVVEGATCTAALHAAGLAVIGRPSNYGGGRHLVKLLADLPADVRFVILGENDRDDDGWPGRDGALHVLATLRNAHPNRIIVWALPPVGAKDARAWLNQCLCGWQITRNNQQHLGTDPDAWHRAGLEFVAKLVPGAEDETLKADAALRKLVAEAQKTEADYKEWVKSYKAQKCERHPYCGTSSKGYETKNGVLSITHFCGRCDCDGCERHRRLKVAEWGYQNILGDGDSLRHEVFVWEGPEAKWRSVSQAMHRAGVDGYGRVVRTAKGLIVFADKDFPGALSVRPCDAVALFLAAVLEMVRKRQSVTWGGSWRMLERVPVNKSLGTMYPAILKAVAEEFHLWTSTICEGRGVLAEPSPGTQPWVMPEVIRIAKEVSEFVQVVLKGSSWTNSDMALREGVALARKEARESMRRGGPPPWTTEEYAESLREALRARAGRRAAS
jgi:hypothetical protein